MATKKFSPAQLAAQKLFAERARAGTLGKGKRKANPDTYNPYASKDMLEEYAGKTDDELRYIIKDAFAAAKAQRGMQSEMKYLDQVNDANTVLYRRRKGLNEITGSKITKMKIERSETPDNPDGIVVTEAGALRFAKQNMPSDLKKAGFVASVFPGARGWVINYSAKGGRKTNPEKVTQVYTVFHRGTSNVAGTVRETSPKAAKEKIANRLGLPTLAYLVARKGERLQNPDKSKPRAYVRRASQITGAPPSKRLVSRRKMALKAPAGYFPNPKVKYTNRAKDMKGDQRVGYAVHMADRPSYQAIAWFTKKDDAVKVAQEASDRTGKQLAVSRIQNYFGAM